MKTIRLLVILFSLAGMVACSGNLSSQQYLPTVVASEPAARRVLKTSIGDFTAVSTSFVEEVNGVKPEPGKKILLIELSRADGSKLEPANFPLADFQKMVQDAKGEIYIQGNDGSMTISTMAGWVGPEHNQFAMGFHLPETLTGYQLFWPGNDPLPLNP